MLLIMFAALAAAPPSWEQFIEPIVNDDVWQSASRAYDMCVTATVNKSRATEGSPQQVAAMIQDTCMAERAHLRQATVSGIQNHFSHDAAPHPEIEADMLMQYLDAETLDLAQQHPGKNVQAR